MTDPYARYTKGRSDTTAQILAALRRALKQPDPIAAVEAVMKDFGGVR